MSNYSKPTLKTLRNRAISEINTYLKGADANLRRRVLNIFASIMAGVGDEVLRRVEYLLKQIFVADCDEEFLVKHGQEHKFPRKLASKATGGVLFTDSTSGSTIPQGTALKRADNVTYTSTAEATVAADGTVTIPVIADNVGKDGNAEAGTIFSFVSPVAGLNNQGNADNNAITGGADVEDIEEYRERLQFFIQNPPTGGSKTDYEIWAREVSGVTRAWCYPTESGAGTVTVRFMMDGTYENGIPLTGDVARVKEHIDTLQPATALVYIEAPIADAIDFTFASLTPNTTDAHTAIEDSLKSLIQSSSIEPGGTLKLSKIRAAISNATGNEDFELTAPASDVVCATGHIPVLGTITYPENS
ncbi:MAG: baseplate J/gp47 family protein [Alphaproteobacteria bacterium]|nr:baseplate J/gp47 family protein [Alphaproteobacteria bacterium]